MFKNFIIFFLLLISLFLVYVYYSNAQYVEPVLYNVLGEVYYQDTNERSEDYLKDMVMFGYVDEEVESYKVIIDSNIEKIEKNKYKVYSGLPQFYEDNGVWKYIEYQRVEEQYYDLIPKVVSKFELVQTAIAQVIFPEIDGVVCRSGVDQTWANILAGAGTCGNRTTDTTDAAFGLAGSGTAGQFQGNYNGVFGFNLENLDGTVSSASMYLFCDDKYYVGCKIDTLVNTPNSSVYGITLTSNSSLANGDYNTKGSTELSGSVTYASWTNQSYNRFIFDSDGYSYLTSAMGTQVNFVIKTQFEVSGTPNGGGGNLSEVDVSNSETTGVNEDPYLIVEVDAPVSGSGSTASVSFESLEFASGYYFKGILLMILGFIFPVWYFNKKRNDYIMKM